MAVVVRIQRLVLAVGDRVAMMVTLVAVAEGLRATEAMSEEGERNQQRVLGGEAVGAGEAAKACLAMVAAATREEAVKSPQPVLEVAAGAADLGEKGVATQAVVLAAAALVAVVETLQWGLVEEVAAGSMAQPVERAVEMPAREASRVAVGDILQQVLVAAEVAEMVALPGATGGLMAAATREQAKMAAEDGIHQ